MSTEKMKIAITYDNGKIWQHFGKTEYFKIYEIENDEVEDSYVISANGNSHGALAGFLGDNEINTVICGGVGAPMVEKLEALGMKVYPGIEGEADDAVENLLSGELEVNNDAVHEGCNHH